MKWMIVKRKHIMHLGLILLLYLCFFPPLLKAELTLNTRQVPVSDAIKKANPFKSPVFKAFNGLSPENVIQTWQEGAAKGDKWLKDEGKPYSSFKQFLVRIVYWLSMTKDGPDAAMSVMAPFFLLIFIVSVFPFAFKALFVPPDMENPQRPENDSIKRRWFWRRRKSQPEENEEEDSFEEEDSDDGPDDEDQADEEETDDEEDRS